MMCNMWDYAWSVMSICLWVMMTASIIGLIFIICNAVKKIK